MISTASLLYEIDLKINNLASTDHQEIPLENKLLLINEAQIKLVKNKIRQDSDNPVGFDGDKKRYHDIQVLIEAPELHKLKPKLVDKRKNKWEVDLKLLDPQFMFFVQGYLTADKEQCKDRVIVIHPGLTKHADVDVLLNNSSTKPSFEWHETFSTISNDKFAVYTDGTFEPKDIYISYIRYPRKVNVEGIIEFDGSDSFNQDSELPDYLKDELLNLIIEEISIITEKQSGVQASPLRKLSSE